MHRFLSRCIVNAACSSLGVLSCGRDNEKREGRGRENAKKRRRKMKEGRGM
jgi:hypothetical protein